MKTRALVLTVILSGSLLISLPWAAFAQSKTVLRFDDLPKLLSERNRHVKGAEHFHRASQERTGFLRRSYLPKVSASAGQENFKRGTLGSETQPKGEVEATVSLFNGGRDSLEDKIRDAEAISSAGNLEHTKAEELKEARLLFWTIVFQKEKIRLLEEAVQLNTKNSQAASRRISAGIATESDRLEFEMSRIELDQDLARLRLQNKSAMRNLAVLVGFASIEEFDVPDTVPHQHDDSMLAKQLDVNKHWSVKEVFAQKDIALHTQSKLGRWWAPSLDIYGSHGLRTFREIENTDVNERYESVVGVKLKFDLFDYQSQAEASAQAMNAVGFEHQAAQNALELNAKFEESKEQLQITDNLIHLTEKNFSVGEKFLSRTLKEYARGAKNSLDVLNATSKYIGIKLRLSEIRRDYQAARAEILAVLGE